MDGVTTWDFVVVGGGAAGLAAASDLAGSGARVLLLEARARTGGRIWTRRPRGWPVPVELGAEFVHGRSPALFELAREAGIGIVRLPDAHVEKRNGAFRGMGDVWRRFDSLSKTMRSKGRDRSVAEYLASRRTLPAADRRLIWRMVEGYNAAPLERASEKALSTAGEGRATEDERSQFRVLSGYDRVADFLLRRAHAAGCRIRRSAIVRAIRWRRGRVDLETSGGARYRARCAVITLPAGVLKAQPGARGAVAFDPDPLPMRRALEGIEMGDVVRVVMRFREAFWRESSGDAAFVHADGPFQTLWTAAPLELPMLTMWAGGPAATRLRERGLSPAIDAAGRELAGLFGTSRSRVRRLLAGVHVHDWIRDPFTRGAYSYQALGGASAPARLARPVDETLFFAGEATSSEESGTVPGAIASGRRAAAQALRRA